MTEPTSAEFDELAAAARSGSDEANAQLWSAVFSLSRWWFLPDEKSRGPRIGVVDGKPFLLAFTSSARARQQAMAWGLAPADADRIDILAIPPESVLQMRDGLERDGVFGVVFDQGLAGFFAPLPNLVPIYEHVRPLNSREEPLGGWYAQYRGTELRADLLDDGVELQGENSSESTVDDRGVPFRTVARSELSALYAINLVATVGGVRAAVLGATGDRLRLAALSVDIGSAPGWTVTDVGVAEAVLPRDEVTVAALRTELPAATEPPVIVQKVLTPQQTRAGLDGRLHRLFGYLSVLPDVVQWRTPAEIVQGLGLDFPQSPFSAQAESVAVLRCALRDGTWRLRNRSSIGPTPIFFLGPEEASPVPVAAELQILDRAGQQRVLMRYAGSRRGWLAAG
ncbi:MAG TPA: hypothetical protein VHC49_03255 [Mycobacteriales bacterium]|nr:hypothetical protein [Mycobacteriales bacterium]